MKVSFENTYSAIWYFQNIMMWYHIVSHEWRIQNPSLLKNILLNKDNFIARGGARDYTKQGPDSTSRSAITCYKLN